MYSNGTMRNNIGDFLGSGAYVCRICLQGSDGAMEKIYNVSERVKFVTRLDVRDGDGLPAHICHQCTFELAISYKFIQRSINNDAILQSRLSTQTQGLSVSADNCSEEHSYACRDPLALDCTAAEQTDVAVQIKAEPLEANADFKPEVDPLQLPDVTIPVLPPDPLEIPAGPSHVTNDFFNAPLSSVGYIPMVTIAKIASLSSTDYIHSSNSTTDDNNFMPEMKTELTDPLLLSGNDSDDGLSNGYPIAESPEASTDVFTPPVVKRKVGRPPKKGYAARNSNDRDGSLANDHPVAESLGALTDVFTPPVVKRKVGRPPKKGYAARNSNDGDGSLSNDPPVAESLEALTDVLTTPVVKKKVGRPPKKRDAAPNSNDVDGSLSNDYPVAESLEALTDVFKPPVVKKKRGRPPKRRNIGSLAKKRHPFGCDYCDASFKVSTYLKLHLRTHSREGKIDNEKNVQDKVDGSKIDDSKSKAFQCPQCNKSFNFKGNMRKHLRTHQPIKTETLSQSEIENCSLLTCDQCAATFKKRKQMIVHFKQNSCKGTECKKEVFKCSQCNEEFADDISLIIHVETKEHFPGNDFPCPLCSESFKSEKSLKSHLTTHGRYTCDYCKKSLPFKANLAAHVEICHMTEIKNNKCPKCMKAFKNETSVQSHLFSSQCHSSYECRKCFRVFDEKTKLSKHSASHPVIQCEICKKKSKVPHKKNKKYFSRAHLRIHVMQAHCDSKQHKRLECNRCRKTFPSLRSLAAHQSRQIISGLTCLNTEYACPTCHSTYSCGWTLNRHMATHTDPKPFKCRRCHEGFADSISLESHADLKECVPVNQCSKCHKVYARKTTLKYHNCFVSKPKSKPRPYKCSRCGEGFDTSGEMSSHYLKNICQGTFNCPACDRSFMLLAAFERHMKKKHPRKKKEYQCNECSNSYKTKFTFKKHFYKVHISGKRIGNFKCLKCNISFKEPYSARRHKLLHHKLHMCDICSKTFTSKQSLESHLITEHAEIHFYCDHCNKAFKIKRHLEKHMRVYHIKADEAALSNICEICGETFDSLLKLNLHASSHATVKNPVTCSYCEDPFTDDTTLYTHVKSHASHFAKELKYECTLCGKRCGTSQGLSGHTIMVHSKHRPYSCATCHWSFATKERISRHVQSHLRAATLSCDICKKGFKCKFQLRTHMRRHTGERPFSCTTCGKTFFSKSTLDIHNRSHTKEGYLECNVCQLKFPTKSSLILHLHRHTAPFPFSCHVCGLGFLHQGQVNVHMRQHTLPINSKATNQGQGLEKSHTCTICTNVYHSNAQLKKHKKRVHANVQVCNICRFVFLSGKELTDHMFAGHTVKLPQECQVCSKTFTSPSLVSVHLVKYHKADFEAVPL